LTGTYRGLFIVLSGLLLQSCATTDSGTQTTTGTSDIPSVVDEQFVATPGLAPRERFSKSLRMLENGKVEQAQVELEAYIAAVASSRSKNARALLEQITTPIDEYFPADYFIISLGDGESLSTLAKKYLGDPLKFYALARYNSITAPSRVFVGQEVRIPLTELARQEKDNPVADTTEDADSSNNDAKAEIPQELREDVTPPVVENIVSIDELILAGMFSEAAEFSNTAPEGSLSNETLIVVYKGFAEESLASNPYVAADAYHRLSELYEQTNDMELALNALNNALSANADHASAADGLASLKPRLVANYYRSASAAFGRQDLETTIQYADKVLALEPDHANAQLYRAQALELQDRLEKLNATKK